MNPDKTTRRGCFIRKEHDGKFTVVDYPTYTYNDRGVFTVNQNQPVCGEFEKTFDTFASACEFCAAENYVVCSAPGSKPVAVDMPDADLYE